MNTQEKLLYEKEKKLWNHSWFSHKYYLCSQDKRKLNIDETKTKT